MSATLATASYVGATILFILSLGGLSNPESSRRGNLYGMIGMTIAVLATVCGPNVTAQGIPWIIGAMVVGSSVLPLILPESLPNAITEPVKVTAPIRMPM